MDGPYDLRDWALGYGERGYAVLPLHSLADGSCTCGRADCRSPGKHPLTDHGVHDATRDPERIHMLWSLYPFANIGIATGTGDRLVVLDVDVMHGGEESLYDLEAQYGVLPDTLQVLTGTEGWHLYFDGGDQTVPSSAGRLGPGLDVRGAGGYVVAPPSLHASGRRYSWVTPPDHVRAPLPDWLLAASQRPRFAGLGTLPGRIGEGGRNAWLASAAGTLRRRGFSVTAIDAALQVENRLRCDPPLPEDEVWHIARSIGRYPTEEPVIFRGNGHVFVE